MREINGRLYPRSPQEGFKETYDLVIPSLGLGLDLRLVSVPGLGLGLT